MLTAAVVFSVLLLVLGSSRMSGIPTMRQAPRVFAQADGTLVEPIEHPIFSTVALDNTNLPQELTFFGYGRGDLVPGAGGGAAVTAQVWHTNLEKGGTLGKPKSFTATGIRFYLAPFNITSNAPALSDPSFNAAAAADSDLLEDLLSIFYSGHVELRIGEKLYVDQPLFQCPANMGFGGAAALALTTNAGTIAQDICLPMTTGVEMRFGDYLPRIESQQSFGVTVRFPWATPPALVDDRLLVCVLDGKLSRGVQ